MGRWLLVPLLILSVALSGVADESIDAKIEAALALPGAEGLDALEILLKQSTDPNETKTVRSALAAAYVARGDPFASLHHWERLVDGNGSPEQRLGYAEALVAVAKANLASGTARQSNVVTYLIDARDVLGPMLEDPSARRDLLGRVTRVHAESWFYEGNFDETLRVLTTAPIDDLGDDDAKFLNGLLGQVLYRKGEYEPAANAFEKAGNVRGAAAAWAAAKNAEKTVAAYVLLLEATPTDVGLLAYAVSAARFSGGAEAMAAALETLEPEAASGPVKAAYRIARFDLLEAAGKAEGAQTLLEEAAALDETDVEALHRLGRLALMVGDRAQATDVFLRAFERSPEEPRIVNALWHLAGLDYLELWKSAGSGPELARTLRIQDALVTAAPDDATAWANLGNTRRVGGLTAEAIAAYEKARAENPYDPAILSDLGLALAAAGRTEDALAAYLASIELDDSHLAGRQNAGRALWRAGRDDDAETQLAAALRKARSAERAPMTYRFLLDRVWRVRQDGELR